MRYPQFELIDLFSAYALLQFAFIVIIIVIVFWRMAVQLKDIMVLGTEKTAEWVGRRRRGL